MRSARTYILAAACLIIGALLYASCRTNILFLNILHLGNLPHLSLPTENPVMYWLVYCLPDGLWYFALLLLQHRLIQQESFISRACFCVAAALPFLLEGLQALPQVVGTFDWCDIVTYLFTLILFLCVRKKF